MPFTPFQPDEPVDIHRGNLPHWRQDKVTYFLTARLADSLPHAKLTEWQSDRAAWLNAHDATNPEQLEETTRKEFNTRFTKRWHDWLDAGLGACVFDSESIRKLLIDRLLRDSSDAYELDAWVIMPNHIHLLLTPVTQTLSKTLQLIKGSTAHSINKAIGKAGKCWQAETYDHIVRSEEQFRHYRRYIADNPIKAKLSASRYAVGLGAEYHWPSAQHLRDHLERT